eukprot:TRINITY_DN58878_c0_g1_i1.p1 TRINITY_DN58878_c0_g1~~TRINITY_DN58878_c0_g1_i1.p1  ORF type:complete len:289 (-),score=42.25 TRINITY_DN58878_c0_g1_i1:62-928(-)
MLRLPSAALRRSKELVSSELDSWDEGPTRTPDCTPRCQRLADRFELQGTIGQGGRGIVQLGRCLRTQAVHAIKTVCKESTAERDAAHREADALRRLSHTGVNRLVDVLEDPFSVHLVLEYIEGQDLLDHMLEAGCLSEGSAADIIRQLLQALAHVHKHKLVHRDVKPENIMIHGSLTAPRVTLIDFGLARNIGETLGEGVEGTLPYMAPEAFAESYPCDASLDLWSVGVVLLALLTGELPSNANSFGPMIDSLGGRVSEDARSFLRGLLAPKESRMSAEKALEHAWLK